MIIACGGVMMAAKVLIPNIRDGDSEAASLESSSLSFRS